jgi:hypothetical protein
MDKPPTLPTPAATADRTQRRRLKGHWRALIAVVTLFLSTQLFLYGSYGADESSDAIPPHAEALLAKCAALNEGAGPPANFWKRSHSDRFVPGTKPLLIRNARIWTGAQNGTEVIQGSVLLENGLIRTISRGHTPIPRGPYKDLEVVDVGGAWVTPGSEWSHTFGLCQRMA